jgi:glycosyltransferase 2 family protein
MAAPENPTAEQGSGKRVRDIVLIISRCAVSAALMYVVLRHISWPSISKALQDIKTGWVAAASLLILMQFIVASVRWKLVLEACNIVVALPSVMRLIFVSAFFNQTLPGTFGGDAARILLLGRANNPWRSSIYSVVIDRATGGTALAGLVLACYPGTATYLHGSNERLALIGISLCCLAGFLVILTIGGLPTPWHYTRRLLGKLRPMSSITFRLFSDPIRGPSVLMLSIAIHLLSTCSVWCLAKALSIDMSPAEAIFLVPPVLLVSTIPISIAGWGLRENAMVSLLGYIGVNPSSGLLVSILFGLLLVAFGGVGGVLWMSTPTHKGR